MAESDIAKWVLERRRRLMEARQRGEGEVGIFWALPESGLLISSVPWSLAEEYGQWMTFGFHQRYYESLSKHILALSGQDYTHYTRGRVSYDKERGVFRVLGSRALLADNTVVSKVKHEFRLPDAVELVQDEHYEP